MSIRFEDGVIKTKDIVFNESCGGIGKFYFNNLKKYGDKVAQITTGTDASDTYASLLTRSTRIAITLQKRGLKPQELIAICSNRENLNASATIFAGQFLGAITFSLDPSLSIQECTELLRQVQPKIILLIDSARDLIEKSLESAGAKADLVYFGKDFDQEVLQKCNKDEEQHFQPLFIGNLKATCVLHFSSGSTGNPKPICLNHYYFLAFAQPDKEDVLDSLSPDRSLHYVSLRFTNWYWVSSSFELAVCTSLGGCSLLRDNFAVNDIWMLIDKYKVTTLVLTPLQCIELSETTKPNNVDVSSLNVLCMGGYVLHKDFINRLRKLFPGTFIYQLYGMTEVGSVSIFNPRFAQHRKLLEEKSESCGIPVNGLWFKFVDMETGKKLGPNQPGELMVKGKKLFNGFHNKDATESFDDEGYFRTGDFMYFDEDFCFYVVDRIKAIIGYKDWLIYPSHIESVLFDHPSVKEAVVIGIPHKIESERLMGVVVLKENVPKVTEEELVKFVKERVEDHKRLREGVKFVKKLPLTATGKIHRIKTKEMILHNLTI